MKKNRLALLLAFVICATNAGYIVAEDFTSGDNVDIVTSVPEADVTPTPTPASAPLPEAVIVTPTPGADESISIPEDENMAEEPALTDETMDSDSLSDEDIFSDEYEDESITEDEIFDTDVEITQIPEAPVDEFTEGSNIDAGDSVGDLNSPTPTDIPTPRQTQTPTPTLTPMPTAVPKRAPYIPPVTDSTVTGLETARPFPPGVFYDFSVTGANAADTYPEPMVGDGRWVPIYWSMSESGGSQYTIWRLGTVNGISGANTYTMYIFMRLYMWDGSGWIETATIDHFSTRFSSLAITPTPTGPTRKQLKAPSDFTIVAYKDKVKISWKAVKNAKTYRIYRKTGGILKELGTTTGRSITDYDVHNGQSCTYYFESSGYSDDDVVYTPSNRSKGVKVIFLTAPGSFKATSKSSKTVTLSWKKNSKGKGYQIRYSQNKNMSGAVTVDISKATKTSTTVKKLAKGKRYYFQIRTVNGKYYSVWSGAKSVVVR